MKEVIGNPGTKTRLIFRFGQFMFATASLGVMVAFTGFSRYTAFWCWYDNKSQSVVATLLLAAACSSAGIVVLYSSDLDFCNTKTYPLRCSKFQISVAFAFSTSFLIAVSSHVMFWILASV